MTVEGNRGSGITIIRTARPDVRDSRIRSNSMPGIRELDGTTLGRYRNNVIADIGHDGDPYNGGGIVLQGVGGLVVGNTIAAMATRTSSSTGSTRPAWPSTTA